MNEEEKQAIKDTEDILKELNKHKDKDFIGRLYYKNKPIEDILQTLLNLIEKQQKEIEELKDKNKTLESLLQGNLYEMYLYYKELAGSYQANSISKDKIRELKGKIQKIYDESPVNEFGMHDCQDTGWIEDMLDELLGE